MKKAKITLAAELGALKKLRGLVKDFCRAEEIDEEVAWALQLSVDEAATNVIQYGYEGMSAGSICLEIISKPEEVQLRLTDFGHPFEPSSVPKPDIDAPLEEREPGGFGLFFIYSTMDHVDYQVTGEGNTLLLRKNVTR